MKTCYCCFQSLLESNMSYCENCKDNGYICHDCICKWSKNGGTIEVCTICKCNSSMKNLPNISREIVINPNHEIVIQQVPVDNPIVILDTMNDDETTPEWCKFFCHEFFWVSIFMYMLRRQDTQDMCIKSFAFGSIVAAWTYRVSKLSNLRTINM